MALHVHCHVGAGTTAEAVDFWRPFQTGYLSWVLRDVAGREDPLPPHFAELATPQAQAVCGSADDVLEDLTGRIAAAGGVEMLMVQMDQGGLPFAEVEASARRFATQVLTRLEGAIEARVSTRR